MSKADVTAQRKIDWSANGFSKRLRDGLSSSNMALVLFLWILNTMQCWFLSYVMLAQGLIFLRKLFNQLILTKVWRPRINARRSRRRAIMLKSIDTKAIVVLNDAARLAFTGCRVHMTAGIQVLYQTQAIVERVQAYNDFNARNDP